MAGRGGKRHAPDGPSSLESIFVPTASPVNPFKIDKAKSDVFARNLPRITPATPSGSRGQRAVAAVGESPAGGARRAVVSETRKPRKYVAPVPEPTVHASASATPSPTPSLVVRPSLLERAPRPPAFLRTYAEKPRAPSVAAPPVALAKRTGVGKVALKVEAATAAAQTAPETRESKKRRVVIDLDFEDQATAARDMELLAKVALEWVDIGSTRYATGSTCSFDSDGLQIRVAGVAEPLSLRYAAIDRVFYNVQHPRYVSLQGAADNVPESSDYDPAHISHERAHCAWITLCLPRSKEHTSTFKAIQLFLVTKVAERKIAPATPSTFPAFSHYNAIAGAPTKQARVTRNQSAAIAQQNTVTKASLTTTTTTPPPLPARTLRARSRTSSSHHEADQHILLQYPRAISNVDRDVVTIYESDLDHLSPGSFLNDNIIAFYLKYITNEVFTALASCQLHHKQRVHIFSSFFYQKLVAHGYDAVRKWTGDVNIFDKDFLIFPINEDLHWYMAVVSYPGDSKRARITFWDSLGSSPKGMLAQRLRQYLFDEWTAKRLPAGEPLPEHLVDVKGADGALSVRKRDSSSSVEGKRAVRLPATHVPVPGQQNHCDCGVFLLYYAERLLCSRLFETKELTFKANSEAALQSWFDVRHVAKKRTELRELIEQLARGERSSAVVERIASTAEAIEEQLVELPATPQRPSTPPAPATPPRTQEAGDAQTAAPVVLDKGDDGSGDDATRKRQGSSGAAEASTSQQKKRVRTHKSKLTSK